MGWSLCRQVIQHDIEKSLEWRCKVGVSSVGMVTESMAETSLRENAVQEKGPIG